MKPDRMEGFYRDLLELMILWKAKAQRGQTTGLPASFDDGLLKRDAAAGHVTSDDVMAADWKCEP
jgi:hypothetical protein